MGKDDSIKMKFVYNIKSTNNGDKKKIVLKVNQVILAWIAPLSYHQLNEHDL